MAASGERKLGKGDWDLLPRSGPQGASHKRRLSPFPYRLTLSCVDHSLLLELSLGGQTFLSGEWGLAVGRDGELATPVSAWQETCRESDRDVDYLELRIELAGGLTVERHVVVARQDRFVLLADAVLSYAADARRTECHSVPSNAPLDYFATLPLAPGVAWQSAKQTREGFLVGRRRALVLPLALPEWRTEQSAGEFGASSGGWTMGGRLPNCPSNGRLPTCPTLHHSTTGRALFAPLFVDLDARRIARPVTWRQLTVGHRGVVQPPDVAVGYRVAVGSRQWLVYRSLAEAASRSLLGHNLNGETLVARFRRDGEVETIIEVE